MSQWIVLPFMCALLAASAFFSASETALFSLQRETLALFRQRGGRRANLALALLDTPRELLATILFGNLVVNTLFYSLSALAAYRLAHQGRHAAAALVGALGLILVIVFGEILPKALAIVFSRPLALAVSVPLYAVYTVVRPVRFAVGAFVRAVTQAFLRLIEPPTRITREELTALVEATSAQGHIPPQEGEMVEGVMGLGETRIRDVMTPRVDIVSCPKGAPIGELLDIWRRTRRTKIVVYEGNMDNILGIAYVRDALLDPSKSLASVTRPASFIPEFKTAEALLHDFQKEAATVAIVVDEYGGTAGIVTLADLAMEIVGPLGDEYERPSPLFEGLGGGAYLLAGDLSLKEWNEMFDAYVMDERLSTLGGFIVMLLGRAPRAGDSAVYKNIKFTVEDVRRHRILSVRAQLLDDEHPSEEAPA